MEKITKPKHGSIEWLRLRHRDSQNKVVFGASDAPALMGASPYKTRSDLFLNKLQEPEVQEDRPEFRRGNILEPVLLEQASEFFSRQIFTPEVVYRDGRFAVSLDGVDNVDNPSVIVEAKTTTRYSIRGSEDLPEEWLWQGWCQQGVLSSDIKNPIPVWFMVLDRDQRFSCVPMPENRSAFQSLKLEADVISEWIELGHPAPDDIDNFTAEQIAKIYPASGGEIELTKEQVNLVIQLDEARHSKKVADEQETELRNAVAQFMLSNDIGMYNGKKIVSWKQQKGRAGVNITLLRNENPELVKHYETEGTPFRVMRTHKIGEI
jgi:predicted phage-related endonuclease